jgi:DNA-binding XRE family transcriptional regulator
LNTYCNDPHRVEGTTPCLKHRIENQLRRLASGVCPSRGQCDSQGCHEHPTGPCVYGTAIADDHIAQAGGGVREAADAYDALGEEFDLARALIEARAAAGLSQSQLARRMKTSQSYIARIEGGKVRPSTDALERFAQATRTRLRILFEPEPTR